MFAIKPIKQHIYFMLLYWFKNNRLLRVALLIVFLFQCNLKAIAQVSAPSFADSIAKKFEYYAAKKQQGVLFAYFDKTVYTNNENVWFTAYLLGGSANKNDVLSLILVNDNGHSILLTDKFVMNKGIAFGNLFLPDSVLTGNYSFILYTNTVVKGNPENVFIQPVSIKNTNDNTFKTTLFLQDTAKIPPPAGRKVLLFTTGAKIIAGATVKYTLGDKRYPALSGTIKTDKSGQYVFTIPNAEMMMGNNVLEAQVTYGKEVQVVKLNLPSPPYAKIVKFYPEGGNLTDGITSVVGWEVKNTQGNPYVVNAVLYLDDKAIDTIATNNYGMGKFTLTPAKGSHYSIKLLPANARSQAYELPPVVSNSPVVTIGKAVVNDTLKLLLQTKTPGKFYVLIHNYQQLFYTVPVQVNSERRVKIDLTDVPKGLAEVTILDSLQRPYAERLFFAHYDKKNSVAIDIDSGNYKTRQKVNLKLSLTDDNGKPITGAVSIACIQANREEIKKTNDIESYFYLKSDLGNLPVKQNYLGNSDADKDFLENILLVKGWRRYTWPDLMQGNPADTIRQLDAMNFKGTIKYFGKPITKPISYIILKDDRPNIGITNANGTFTLDNADIQVPVGKKMRIYASGGGVMEYTFNIPDPYDKPNNLLAADYEPANYTNPAVNEHSQTTEDLKWLTQGKLLKEVKIKGEDDNTLYGGKKNACGDYVCLYGILNCPNHVESPLNTIPIEGHYYTYNRGQIKYEGCNVADLLKINSPVEPIHYTMEFYPADYGQLSPAAPEYLSTIYWKDLYNISPEKEAAISFYTSDITGAFKIIVQGVTTNGVVYGEKTFTVNK